MHIPDGYLSPTTCAALYAGSAPFWYVSLQRVQQALHTRLVPLLSLFSAFCFVIMMFNLPLPGGTTGHAVGIGLAAVVLGPWASMLAVSIALVIQALFFGDGGITAIGANCFNMAIVGSLVSYGVYRTIAGRSPLLSPRRVMAAGVAGYAAINVSALLAAIEFGIQPMFYRDAAGAPLYCPYPLSIAIPAMMIGHLTIAGLAEFFVSAGVVGFLQRSDSTLLRSTSGLPADDIAEVAVPRPPSLRPLWLGLGTLLILTPLGILAGGAAWGEWVASDYVDPASRRQIAASSLHQAPPVAPPAGLERLSTIWTAPFARYAPPYVRSPWFGYLLSAMFGVGLVVVVSVAAGLVFRQRERSPGPGGRAMSSRGSSFVERTIDNLYEALERAMYAETVSRGHGLLQGLDPRVKLLGLLALIAAATLSAKLWVIAAILMVALLLAVLSRLSFRMMAPVWVSALLFTGAIAVPALFLTPGDTLYKVPGVHWGVTSQGLHSAGFLILRVEASATLALLLIFSTPWTHVLKALRVLHVPVVFVVVLGMTFRYILLLLETAREMFESRKSRTVGKLTGSDQRRMAIASGGVLITKAFHLSGEVFLAMQARGFRGEVYLMNEFRMKSRDWAALALFATAAGGATWVGR